MCKGLLSDKKNIFQNFRKYTIDFVIIFETI